MTWRQEKEDMETRRLGEIVKMKIHNVDVINSLDSSREPEAHQPQADKASQNKPVPDELRNWGRLEIKMLISLLGNPRGRGEESKKETWQSFYS